jgi:transcriptional regulator with XRE-family HTH domain
VANDDTVKRLMARVKIFRQALGLSQEAFAERAGLKYKHYQSVEAGRKLNLTLATLEKMAKACGLELSELLDFEAEPMAWAEDPAKHEFHPIAGKGKSRARKHKAK